MKQDRQEVKEDEKDEKPRRSAREGARGREKRSLGVLRLASCQDDGGQRCTYSVLLLLLRYMYARGRTVGWFWQGHPPARSDPENHPLADSEGHKPTLQRFKAPSAPRQHGVIRVSCCTPSCGDSRDCTYISNDSSRRYGSMSRAMKIQLIARVNVSRSICRARKLAALRRG